MSTTDEHVCPHHQVKKQHTKRILEVLGTYLTCIPFLSPATKLNCFVSMQLNCFVFNCAYFCPLCECNHSGMYTSVTLSLSSNMYCFVYIV